MAEWLKSASDKNFRGILMFGFHFRLKNIQLVDQYKINFNHCFFGNVSIAATRAFS